MHQYLLSQEEQDRIRIIKWIAIVFVVYIHAYTDTANVQFQGGAAALALPDWLMWIEDGVSRVIAGCAVPFFFLLSSVLLFQKKRPYVETIRKKLKTLLIPYIIWNTFWILVWIVLQNAPVTASFFSGSYTPILQSSFREWLELYGIGTQYPHDYPLWFLRDLLVVTACFPVIGKLADRFPKLTLGLSAVGVFLPTVIPFQTALVWFCMGAALVRLQLHLTAVDRIPMTALTLVYAVAAAVVLWAPSRWINNGFLFLGIVFWTRVSKELYEYAPVKTVLLKLANYTFIVYAAHQLTLSCVRKLCVRVLPSTPGWLLAEYILIPAVVITGCILGGVLLKKIVPQFYGMATGQR